MHTDSKRANPVYLVYVLLPTRKLVSAELNNLAKVIPTIRRQSQEAKRGLLWARQKPTPCGAGADPRGGCLEAGQVAEGAVPAKEWHSTAGVQTRRVESKCQRTKVMSPGQYMSCLWDGGRDFRRRCNCDKRDKVTQQGAGWQGGDSTLCPTPNDALSTTECSNILHSPLSWVLDVLQD